LKRAASFTGQEELRILDALPAEAVRGQTAAGYEQVDVRMVAQIARPGLEHRGDAEFGAEVFGLGGQVLQRAGAFPEQGGIPLPLGGADGFAQLLRHREGHQEIRHGQQARALAFEPERGVVPAAAGTRPVVARMIREVVLAAGAVVELPAQGRGPAPEDRPHGGVLFSRDEPSELRQVGRPVRR
jgi:hypothetical protein